MYIIGIILFIIFSLFMLYMFSDEHLDKAENKMIEEIVKERLGE